MYSLVWSDIGHRKLLKLKVFPKSFEIGELSTNNFIALVVASMTHLRHLWDIANFLFTCKPPNQ